MKAVPFTTLLSDFGLQDAYVAEMKAVILSICPDTRIVDISHEIRRFNIHMGAYILASAAPYFPAGTIHVAVVDPGVGTKRRPIIVETKCSFYVGPDNGILMLAAHKEGIRHVYHIKNSQYMLPQVSRTFHGRDIFAPAAAHLANGHTPSDFGPEIHDYVLPEFAKPHMKKSTLSGEIIHVDGFGNLVTNISREDLEKIGIRESCDFVVKFNGKMMSLRLCSAYGEVTRKSPLAIIGSGEFLEFSVNQGKASQVFSLKIGDHVLVSHSSEMLCQGTKRRA